jgi:hypothetical protein
MSWSWVGIFRMGPLSGRDNIPDPVSKLKPELT